jgi:hypothetical protein
MPTPRGVDKEGLVKGYMIALAGFPLQPVLDAIKAFIRGDVEELSSKFLPHPPELANLVKRWMPKREYANVHEGKDLYRLTFPQSKIIQRKITKDYGRRMVEEGMLPRGSIWIPGPLDDHPEIGDVYGPDPEFNALKPLDYVTEQLDWVEPTADSKARVDEMYRKFKANIPVNDKVARLWDADNKLPKGKLDSNWTQVGEAAPKVMTDEEALIALAAKANEHFDVSPEMIKHLAEKKEQDQ